MQYLFGHLKLIQAQWAETENTSFSYGASKNRYYKYTHSQLNLNKNKTRTRFIHKKIICRKKKTKYENKILHLIWCDQRILQQFYWFLFRSSADIKSMAAELMQ